MKHKPFDPARPIIVSGPTSPKNEIGKQVSSQNGTGHGCCSTATLILPTESLEDFKALERTWLRSYEPIDELEVHLIHQLVQADWFLLRSSRTLADVQFQIAIEKPNPMDWTDREHQAIQRLSLYQTARRHEFNKARKVLDDHRKIQASERRKALGLQEKERAKAQHARGKTSPRPGHQNGTYKIH